MTLTLFTHSNEILYGKVLLRFTEADTGLLRPKKLSSFALYVLNFFGGKFKLSSVGSESSPNYSGSGLKQDAKIRENVSKPVS